jgi:hypothetical protein
VPDVLASDTEREATANRLRDAAGEGRLTLEELTGRLDHAYAARTRGDLARLTADLPAPTPGSVPVPGTATPASRRGSRWVVAVLSGTNRRGRWEPGPRCTALAVMGGCTLDLRQAQIVNGELEIRALAVMGGIEVIVPEGVKVEVGGLTIMGGKSVRLGDDPPQPTAPVIHVRVLAVMGGVEVKTERPRLPGSILA